LPALETPPQPDLAVTTRAKYRQTLAVLEVELATAPVTGAAIGGVLAQRCPDAAGSLYGVSTRIVSGTSVARPARQAVGRMRSWEEVISGA
jgi:hypothetical protein